MRAFIAALGLASIIFWFFVDASLIKVPKNKGSDEKNITIAFILNEFEYSETNLKSEVGTWLTKIKNEADYWLKNQLRINISLEITDVKLPRRELQAELKKLTKGGLMNADQVFNYLKKFFKDSYNPDILTVVTKVFKGETIVQAGGSNASEV
uniref:Putative lipocalin n=1 Tax=Ixodes ricinus TaxID=34613 RepID=A0A6B0UVW2_IXORI